MCDIKMISKEEECIGKYSTKKKAKQIAKMETTRTKREHHIFLTHYFCLKENINKMCWTIILK